MSTVVPPAGTANTERIRWAFDRLNEHDVAAVKALWTAETIERFPDRTCVGADEIAAYFEDVFKAVPDFTIEITTLVEQDEHVYVSWKITGTHKGVLLGIKATGKPLLVDGVDHFVMRDGVVVSNFVVFDQMQYARQIGMLPADHSPADRALKTAFNTRTSLVANVMRAKR